MMREMDRSYNPEEEMNKTAKKPLGKAVKKPGAETEMIEFLVETTSFTTGVSNLGIDKVAGVGGLAGGIEKLNSLDLNKFQSIRGMAGYAKVYEEGLDKTNEFMAKDKEKTEKKIKEIRDWLKRRKTVK